MFFKFIEKDCIILFIKFEIIKFRKLSYNFILYSYFIRHHLNDYF